MDDSKRQALSESVLQPHDEIDRVIIGIYRELYKNAEPQADFDELVRRCPLNERGQIDIPFNDYQIEKDKFDEIIEAQIKRLPKRRRNLKAVIENTVSLGCSPKIKKDD